MRKALILVLLLCALSVFPETDVTVSGNSEIKWGINLDEGATGFIEPVTASTIQLNFITGEDTEKGVKGDLYAYIKLAGFGISVNNDLVITPPTVEAKLIILDCWLLVSSNPDMKVNYVSPIEDDDGDDDATDEGVSVEVGKSGGITIGYDGSIVKLEAGIVSENDWLDDGADDEEWGWVDDDDDPSTPPVWGVTNEDDSTDSDDINDENAYGLSGKIGVVTDFVECEVMGLVGINYVDAVPAALGGSVLFKVSPFTVNGKCDFSIGEDETLYEVGGGVSYTIISGLTLSSDITYNESDDVDMKTKLVEADGGDGALKVVGGEISNTLNNLTADEVTWNVDGKINLTLDKFKPYMSLGYGSDELWSGGVGLEISAIENAKVVVDYVNDDIVNTLGIITVGLTISY